MACGVCVSDNKVSAFKDMVVGDAAAFRDVVVGDAATSGSVSVNGVGGGAAQSHVTLCSLLQIKRFASNSSPEGQFVTSVGLS